MAQKRGLGRGLGALISEGRSNPVEADARRIELIPIEEIRASSVQPRSRFDEESLAELTESIREQGILQPLLVREQDNGYELIAGERRLRAARRAELPRVPVIVLTPGGDSETLALALVENLQREDLNVLEEAEGYRALSTGFNMTQEDIARKVGKARASVANALRLLTLPDPVKEYIRDGRLNAGHAKLLSSLSPEEQLSYAKRIVQEGWSVRSLEKAIQGKKKAPRKAVEARSDVPSAHLAHLSGLLHHHFGTGVRISPCKTLANGKKQKGSIEIDFYSNDDLDRILSLLGLTEQ